MNTNQGVKNNAAKTVADVCKASYQKLAAQIGRVREDLLAELQGTLDLPERLFRLALDEAEALAWQTGYPHLLFPALATEKLQTAAGWKARQQSMWKKSVHAMSL